MTPKIFSKAWSVNENSTRDPQAVFFKEKWPRDQLEVSHFKFPIDFFKSWELWLKQKSFRGE